MLSNFQVYILQCTRLTIHCVRMTYHVSINISKAIKSVFCSLFLMKQRQKEAQLMPLLHPELIFRCCSSGYSENKVYPTYSQNWWIGHLYKSGTCVKASVWNFPDYFLYELLLYKSTTFINETSAGNFIPKRLLSSVRWPYVTCTKSNFRNCLIIT